MNRVVWLGGALILLLLALLPTRPVLAPSQLVAAPDAYRGAAVIVTGVAAPWRIVCTTTACTRANVCCNECSGLLALEDGNASLPISGTTCTGTNCNVTCMPLAPQHRYAVTGTVIEQYGEHMLALERFEELP